MRRILPVGLLFLCLFSNAGSASERKPVMNAWSADVSNHVIALTRGSRDELLRIMKRTDDFPPSGVIALFRIRAQADGTIISCDIIQSSKFPRLDNTMKDILIGSGRIPPAPSGVIGTGTFTLPVKFSR